MPQENVNAGYTNPMNYGSHIGFADSALLCTRPAEVFDYYMRPMKDPDYSCPATELPFSYPGWNEKWYSPVCRPWFKDQRDNISHGTLSDLYPFA